MTPEMAADWVACLGQLRSIRKNKAADMGTHRYRYADLDSTLDYINPILASYGLAQSQSFDADGRCLTTFTHRSGEQFVVPGVLVKPIKGDPQAQGSAISYARRYSLLPALGIATADDDGRAASAPPPAAPRQRAKAAPRSTTADGPSEHQTKHVMAMFGELGITDRAARLARTSSIVGHDVASWSDVTADEADQVIDALRRDRGQAPAGDMPPHPGDAA